MMAASTALGKVRDAIEWLLRREPKWSGIYRVEIHFRDGKVVKLKKLAIGPIL